MKEYLNEHGALHRIDGPAIEKCNGDKEWYHRGFLHRADGPAIEWADGHKAWYQNGKLHRLDGPAIEWTDGHKQWAKNGFFLSFDYKNEIIIILMNAPNAKKLLINNIQNLTSKQINLLREVVKEHFPEHLDILGKLLILK